MVGPSLYGERELCLLNVCTSDIYKSFRGSYFKLSLSKSCVRRNLGFILFQVLGVGVMAGLLDEGPDGPVFPG